MKSLRARLQRLRRRRPRLPRPPRPHRRRRTLRGEALLYVVAGALAATAGTWLLGWWTVPVLAAIGGLIWFDLPGVARLSALGGGIAWALLLVLDGRSGRAIALGRALGGALYLPWPLLIIVTLLFAAGLAWSAATIAQRATGALVKR